MYMASGSIIWLDEQYTYILIRLHCNDVIYGVHKPL